MMTKIVTASAILGLASILLAAPASAQSQKKCYVTDPTGTPLRVRSEPNGREINRLRNGREVYIQETGYDAKGRPWAYVAGYYKGNWRNWGWVYREFISCP